MKSSILKKTLCGMLTAAMVASAVPFSASAASLKLSYSSISVTKGYSSQLKATGASNVKWSTSDSSVATVSSSGKVYAKGKGTCTITAKSGNLSASCKVKVVNGKLSLSQSKLNIDEGDSEVITVTAKGSHSLSIVHENKNVAKASWVIPSDGSSAWDGNDVALKVSGISEGTARIKVRMKYYTEVYKIVTVNVSASEFEFDEGSEDEETAPDTSNKTSRLLVDASSLNVNKDGTASVEIYTDKPDNISVVSGDSSIAEVTVPSWTSGTNGTVTVTGKKSGTTTITVSAKDNPDLKKTINVTVVSDGYYEASTYPPAKRFTSDTVYEWVSGTSKKYMLLPAGYDIAYVNSVIAKEDGKASYYSIYDTLPEKLSSDDYTTSFKADINGKSVTRYILLPKDYDSVREKTEIASYTGKYSYWIIYNVSPVRTSTTDVVETWETTVNGQKVKRYVLLPANYSKTRLEELKNSDVSSSASSGAYYTVTNTVPEKINATDTVYQFNYTLNNYPAVGYILLPEKYDTAKCDTAVAKTTGSYSYWVVYTESPEKTTSSDVVKDWSKVVDNKVEKRYILLPGGYNESILNEIMNEDVNGSSVYYTVYTVYPTGTLSTDIVYSWINPKTNKMKWMLLPAETDIIKRNDVVVADTGVYNYYAPYSTKPNKQKDSDKILTQTMANYGVVYMLVPENYSMDKVTQGMNGQDVAP